MAKGQISDDELQNSLRAIGTLGGITSSGARRDSPFGAGVVRKGEPLLTSVTEVSAPAEPEPRSAIPIEVPPAQQPYTDHRRSVKMDRFPRKPATTAASRTESNARRFGEKVSLQMPPEMRDDVNFLATKLQRRKTTKEQRITANTVMRVAIQFLLEELKLRDTDHANTEEELFDLVKRKILGANHK